MIIRELSYDCMDQTSHNGKQGGKRVRRAALILVALLLVTVASLLIFITNADLGRYKDPLLAYASEALGRELRIEGDLSIRLGRTLDIRASEIYLADAEWSENEHMLELGELVISLQTRSILSAPLQIHSLELHDATILVTSDDAGDSNWQLLPDKPSDEPDERSDDVPLLVDEATFSNLRIVLRGPTLKEASEIRIDRYTHGVNGERIADTLSGEVNGFPLSFNSDLGPRQNIWRGKPVDMQLTGSLGEVTLTASALVDDLLDPQRPSANLQLYGPDAAYLLNVLKLPPVANGPLTISSDVSIGEERVNVESRIEVGAFVFEADGWLREVDPQADFDFTFDTSGQQMDHVGRLFGVESIPGGPFKASGNISRDAGSISFGNVSLDIGNNNLMLSGVLDRFAPPAGRKLRLAVRGDDIAELRDLLQVPGILSGPFDIEIALADATQLPTNLVIRGTIDDIHESITINPSSAPDFVGTTVEFDVRGADATTVSNALDISGIAAAPFRANGKFEYRGKGLQFATTQLQLGQANLNVAGYLAFASKAIGSTMQIDFDTAALDETLLMFGIDGAPPRSVQLQALLAIDDARISATDIDANIGAMNVRGSASTATERPGATASFDIVAQTDDLAKSWPLPGEYAPPSSAASVRALGRLTDARVELDDLSINVGDASVKLDGVIDRPPNLDATEFALSANIPSLAGLGTFGTSALPDLPVNLSGQFNGTRDSISGDNVSATIGSSRIETDFAYRHAAVPTIDITLNSPSLDLRPFLQESQDEPEPAAAASETGRSIPNADVPVDKLRMANVNVDIQLAELLLRERQFTDIDLRASIQDGGLTVEKLGVRGLRGQLSTNLSYLPGDDGYQLATSLTGSDLIIGSPDEPRERLLAKPRYDLETTLTASGSQVHALLATLDGYVVMNSGAGKIANVSGRLGDLFLGDFLMQVLNTINPFAKSSNEIQLACAVILLDINDGVVSGTPAMVAQTAAITATASGSVNLGTEELNFDMTTKQRKGIGVSIGDLVNPYFRIAGTLSEPRMVLDEKGALIEGGAAIATAGLSVLAKGMRDRFLSDEDPCGTALNNYREAR